MHTWKTIRIVNPLAARCMVILAVCFAPFAAYAYSLDGVDGCVEFQNRWHMAQGHESPASTAFFSGHVARGADDASAPHDGTYTLVRSQCGLPFYGGVSLRPVDSDGDGIPDRTEGEGDPDGDSLGNWQDPDSDDDGIPDQTEAGPDPYNPLDTDGDGAPDYVDLDSDDDSLQDATEGLDDPDLDRIPNYLDLDSDDDGWSDEEEAALGSDPYSSDSVPLPLLVWPLLLVLLIAAVATGEWKRPTASKHRV